MRTTVKCLPVALLSLLLACGGGGGGTTPQPPTPVVTTATLLDYINPTAGDFQLVKNTTKSTNTHLVLDLVGPTQGNAASGIGFYATADNTRVQWTKVDAADSALVQNGAFSAPVLFASEDAGTLQAGVYQPGTTAAVAMTGRPVLGRVALDLKTGVPVGTVVTFQAVAGKARVLNAPAATEASSPVTVAVGTLTAK